MKRKPEIKILPFRITGIVIESVGEMPVGNLKVEAWDKDIKYDDLLGQTFTDAEGRFQIEFDSTYFREHAPDARPDLMFKVFLGKRSLKLVDDKVYANAEERTEVTLKVFMPELLPEGKNRVSMAKALDISAFLQKSDFKGLIGQFKETANTQFNFVTDMFKNSLADFDFTPIKVGENQRENIVGKDVKMAGSQLHSQNVTVNEIKKYEPKLNRKSLSELTSAPMNLKPGQKVDLYEENGKVKYYTLVKEPATVAATVSAEEPEVKKLQDELRATRQIASEKDEKISKLEMEMESLKKDHNAIKALLQSDNMVKLMQQLKTTEQPTIVKKRGGKIQ
jgi:hypothetical protein